MNSNLNLADAILMGSSVIKAKAGVQHQTTSEGTVGCALGMANISAGAEYCNFDPTNSIHRKLANENPRSRGAAMIWGDWVKKVVVRPCECTHKTEEEIKNEAQSVTPDDASWINRMRLLAGPRNSWVFKILPRKLPIQDVITHLFDVHVAREDSPDWTIEQLADWVRSVEGPAREEEAEKRKKEMEMEITWPITYMGRLSISSIDAWMASPNHLLNVDGSVTCEPLLGGHAANSVVDMATISISHLKDALDLLKEASQKAEEKTGTEAIK